MTMLLLSLTSSCHCLIWWRPAHNLVASSQQALDIRECKAVKLLLVKPMFHLSKVLRENMYMQKKPMQMFVCYNVNCVFYGPGMTNLRNCRNDTRPTPLSKYLYSISDCENSINLPGSVTIGVPAHNTSIPVVCPLHSGVSRHTSASCPLRTCSSWITQIQY